MMLQSGLRLCCSGSRYLDSSKFKFRQPNVGAAVAVLLASHGVLSNALRMASFIRAYINTTNTQERFCKQENLFLTHILSLSRRATLRMPRHCLAMKKRAFFFFCCLVSIFYIRRLHRLEKFFALAWEGGPAPKQYVSWSLSL